MLRHLMHRPARQTITSASVIRLSGLSRGMLWHLMHPKRLYPPVPSDIPDVLRGMLCVARHPVHPPPPRVITSASVSRHSWGVAWHAVASSASTGTPNDYIRSIIRRSWCVAWHVAASGTSTGTPSDNIRKRQPTSRAFVADGGQFLRTRMLQ
jgi:hypothetical protein